jgi:hypothetical protein
MVPDQEMSLDALDYLGGLFEARFYQPHSTTDDPRDEIREAASLYGLDLAMMMSIAKVESDFDPRVRTGPRPPFGLPDALVTVLTSRLSCRKAGNTRIFTPDRESFGGPG